MEGGGSKVVCCLFRRFSLRPVALLDHAGCYLSSSVLLLPYRCIVAKTRIWKVANYICYKQVMQFANKPVP